jgi:hypothetical protein
MTCDPHDLDRFVRAVHRRWVLVRAAEHVGMCLLGGCVLSLVFLPILLWRGEPALRIVEITMLISVAAGLVVGVVRRPDLMSAAGEADRQLDLADLLSTALATRDRSPSDPWAAVVIAMADTRCRTLAANDVILNRFGARAWGGIGLAAALVLTLGLMSANPRPSVARAPLASNESALPARIAVPKASDVQDRRARAAQSRRDGNQRADIPVASVNENGATARDNASGASQHSTWTPHAGGGAGLATSQTPANPLVPTLPSATNSRPGDHGDAAAGGSQTGSTAGHDEAPAGLSVGNNPATHIAPPWQSSSWPAARSEALSAVRDGRVPDAYRDLVRAYFTPQPQ